MTEIRKIYAKYNEKTIRVYQAYNEKIADEAVGLNTFGSSFKLERMTWIKPSFLWMMYRSGWGTKSNQERILAIDILKEGFNEILSNAVLSKYDKDIYFSYEGWKEKVSNTDVVCQFDPDRDIYGNPIDKRAIQLGIRNNMVKRYVNEWIYKITDITEDVYIWREQISNKTFDEKELPLEEKYLVNEKIHKVLGINI